MTTFSLTLKLTCCHCNESFWSFWYLMRLFPLKFCGNLMWRIPLENEERDLRRTSQVCPLILGFCFGMFLRWWPKSHRLELSIDALPRWVFSSKFNVRFFQIFFRVNWRRTFKVFMTIISVGRLTILLGWSVDLYCLFCFRWPWSCVNRVQIHRYLGISPLGPKYSIVGIAFLFIATSLV